METFTVLVYDMLTSAQALNQKADGKMSGFCEPHHKTTEQTFIFVDRYSNSDSRNLTLGLNYEVLGTQLSINERFVTGVFALQCT